MRTITCPYCGFSREVSSDSIPEGARAANCPACGRRFRFGDETQTPQRPDRTPDGGNGGRKDGGSFAAQEDTDDEDGRIVCPVCSTRQEPSGNCLNCGLIFSKWEEVRREGQDFYLADTGELLRGDAGSDRRDALEVLPPAGFWQRLTAALIDLTIITVAQLFFGLLLTGVAMLASWGWQFDPGGWQLLMMPVKLFNIVLFLAYFVVFTGYGGQTPGKMLLRLQVIRSDDGEIGYGRAFVREAPGKLISTLTFGVGFIMIAFQPDKRGLHDLLAGSSVVKLR